MNKEQLVERRVTYPLEHDGKFYVLQVQPESCITTEN
jgi:hypothetical protein